VSRVAHLVRTFVFAADLGQDRTRPSVRATVAATGEESQQHRSLESPDGSRAAFTILEILIVIGIILILAGFVLAISGFVQEKGKRSRAEAEIAAMSAALESYKADNGIYPRGNANLNPNSPYDTDALTALTDQNFSTKNPPDPIPTSYDANPNSASTGPTAYKSASFALYAQLSGNSNGDRSTVTGKSYFQFKPNMLYPPGGTGTILAIVDPFGSVYGYSTAKVNDPNKGFNPTYDLWSTAGTNAPDKALYEQKWIKNW
jgi:type II secretory pathway pseudopilin PulG